MICKLFGHKKATVSFFIRENGRNATLVRNRVCRRCHKLLSRKTLRGRRRELEAMKC